MERIVIPRLFPWTIEKRRWTPQVKLESRPSNATASPQTEPLTEQDDYFGRNKNGATRIDTVNPMKDVRDYLHPLLFHKTGAKRFSEMRTLSSVVCAAH